jgi:cyanophycinase
MADQGEIHRRRFLQRAVAGTASLAGVFTMGGSSLHDSETKPGNSPRNNPALPRASLMLIGGSYPVLNMNEIEKRLPDDITPDECDPYGHYRKMLELCPNKPPVVEFITSASRRYADENARQHEKLFTFLGAGEVHSTSTHDASKAKHNPALIERLRRADLIYVTGGDQTLLADLFKNTDAYNVLRERYANDPNLVIAGTSAGAMIMARSMIDGNPERKSDPTPMNTGFAMLPVIMETHTDERGREPRLLSALEQSPGNIGMALDGATAVIIRNGKASVDGPGRVIVATSTTDSFAQDNSHATDLSALNGCAPYKAKGMTAHIYHKGDSFDLGEYARIPAAQNYLGKALKQSIAAQER